MGLFNKNKDKDLKTATPSDGASLAQGKLEEVKAKDVKDVQPLDESKDKKEDSTKKTSDNIIVSDDSNIHTILKGFYVSEKSSMAQSLNQYVFEVFKRSNKSEIKKHVGRHFNVEVESVKIINLPKKRRKMGKHPGFKPGVKKAIVILKKGYTIDQASA